MNKLLKQLATNMKKKKKMKKIDLSSSNIISGKFLNVGNSFPSTRLMQLITFTVSRH